MTRRSAALLDRLAAAGLELAALERVVRTALDEDLAFGPDVTTIATVPAGARAAGDVVAREAGTLAGLPVAQLVLECVAGDEVAVVATCADGDEVAPGDVVLSVEAPTRELLTAERTMLNLLTHLSGVATATRAWVDAVAGTAAVVRDTRKTTPGLRLLEKYAVRCGGGSNHRLGLGDAVLIKDNHVAAAGALDEAVRRARVRAGTLPLEVECDTLDQVAAAIAADVPLILLDNMTLTDIRRAVAMARAAGGVRLEASGGLSLERARAVASTGVDYLAVGSITHSAPALDLGLDLRAASPPQRR